jgi:hypothetical protein
MALRPHAHTDKRISKSRRTPRVMQSISREVVFLVAASGICAILIGGPARALAASCPAGPTFPTITFVPGGVKPGYAAATVFSGCGPNPNGMVVGLWDVRLPCSSSPPTGPGENWCAPMYYNAWPGNPTGLAQDQWTATNLGQVFGVTFDRASPNPNIYVTPTTVYGDFAFPGSPIGRGGAIYRLSGTTGAICVVATLPQPAAPQTGLGDVCYDYDHNQLFVSNLDDGKIYRIGLGASTTNPSCPGTVLDWYDHGAFGRQSPIATPAGPLPAIQDNTALRFTPRGRRVWAVQYFRSRLYYSTWSQDGDPAASLPEKNAIWSVGLDSTGTYDYSTVRREFELPPFGIAPLAGWPDMTLRSYPVSDIAFSAAGRMLVAERGIIGDTGALHNGCPFYLSAHQSRVLEYTGSSGNWIPQPTGKFNVGVGPPNIPAPHHSNSAGGIDYTCDGDIWASGDALLWGATPCIPPNLQEYVYGLQHMPGNGNLVCNDFFVDEDGQLGSGSVEDKTQIGDVEIAPRMGSISGMKFNDLNCDGIKQGNEPGLSGWTIIVVNDSTGRQISTTTVGGGTYSFNNLPLGTYTVLEQQQNNYNQSQPRCAARTVTLGCVCDGPLAVGGIDFGNCPCPAMHLQQVLNTTNVAWQVVAQPAALTSPLPRPANVVAANAGWCQTCGGTWISASATGSSFNPGLPVGDYTYQYCFCLDPRFSEPSLNLCLLTDNAGSVLLNGNVIGTTPAGSYAGPNCVSISTINQSFFRPGENCVQVIVNNGGGPSGMNILSGDITAADGQCCVSICPCVKPPSGMIGWWPMFETAGHGVHDIAGTPQHALMYDGVGVLGNINSQVGAVGQAMCLDGINDLIESPPIQSTALNIGLDDVTIDAWINLPPGSSGYKPVVDKIYFPPGMFTLPLGYYLGVNNGLAVGGLDYSLPVGATGPNVADGKWHHLALTVIRSAYDGGKLYVDGVPVKFDPTALVVTDLSNPATFRIGADHDAGGIRYFNGCIDEVQFFKRALSAGEIYSIYAAKARGKCTEDCETRNAVSVCANQSTTPVSITICNSSATAPTYTVTPGPASGCSHASPTFAPLSKVVTVPPYKCVTVSFTASVPAFTLALQTSCFKYTITNSVTGAVMTCNSMLIDRRDICGIPEGAFASMPMTLNPGQLGTVQFDVSNTGLPAGNVPYVIEALNDSGSYSQSLELNGLPPGNPIVGLLALPGPGGPPQVLSVDVMMSAADAFNASEIVLSTDVDGDGNYEPLSAVLVMPDYVISGDMNCDGLVDVEDIPLFAQALLTPNGYLTDVPACDIVNADVDRNGIADGGDCQKFIELIVNK